MKIQISVDKSDITATIQAKIDEIKEKAAAALYQGGELIATACQENCPVDTGLLRSSIEVEQISDTEVVVAPHTDYAYYVEVGHHTRSGSFVPGRFYMRNGTEESRDTVADYIRSQLTE
jgi:hypothetical protein